MVHGKGCANYPISNNVAVPKGTKQRSEQFVCALRMCFVAKIVLLCTFSRENQGFKVCTESVQGFLRDPNPRVINVLSYPTICLIYNDLEWPYFCTHNNHIYNLKINFYEFCTMLNLGLQGVLNSVQSTPRSPIIYKRTTQYHAYLLRYCHNIHNVEMLYKCTH